MKKSQQGFSLLEVMIALTVFAVYSVAMIATQTSNMNSSVQMKTDLTLHNLAELKMNESLVDVTEFTNATENDPDSGKFEIEGYKEYKFLVEYKKIKFPSLDQLMGAEEEDSNSQDNSKAMKKIIFEKLKKNIEEIIWQISVTVTEPNTNYSYTLNSWVTNEKAKIDTNFSF